MHSTSVVEYMLLLLSPDNTVAECPKSPSFVCRTNCGHDVECWYASIFRRECLSPPVRSRIRLNHRPMQRRPNCNAYIYIIGSRPTLYIRHDASPVTYGILREDISTGNKYNQANMSGTISPPPHKSNNSIRAIIKREKLPFLAVLEPALGKSRAHSHL
jgi:hypothetical protein